MFLSKHVPKESIMIDSMQFGFHSSHHQSINENWENAFPIVQNRSIVWLFSFQSFFLLRVNVTKKSIKYSFCAAVRFFTICFESIDSSLTTVRFIASDAQITIVCRMRLICYETTVQSYPCIIMIDWQIHHGIIRKWNISWICWRLVTTCC